MHSLDELKKNGGSGTEFRGFVYGIHEQKGFYSPSGKIEIYHEAFAKAGFDALPTFYEPIQSPVRTPELAKEHPLILLTGR